MTDKRMNPHQLRAIRLRLNMTQWEFGEALGYPKKGASSRIYELEHGIRAITLVRIKLLRILEQERAERPPRSVRLATRQEFR